MLQLDFAQAEYEKTYSLFKCKPVSQLFSVIVHNLLLNYARQGLIEKAEVLIDEYQTFLGKDKHQNWLEFSNDLLHAGREAHHQAWLDRAYDIQAQIKPKNKDEAFVLGLSELRIRLNDECEFDDYYHQFMPKLKASLAQDAFDLKQTLFIHRELKHVLHAKLAQAQGANPWLNDFIWLTKHSYRWFPLLDSTLANVDTALAREKVHWLKAKQRLLKDSLAFESDLIRLESSIKEVAKIQMRVIDEWKAVDNIGERVEEQIVLVDEALCYTSQARKPEEHAIMASAFKQPAENTLDSLLDWSLALKTFRGQENRIIFIAAALIKMRQNRTLAKQLMDKLHAEPFSLKHYALFVCEQYYNVNRILANPA